MSANETPSKTEHCPAHALPPRSHIHVPFGRGAVRRLFIARLLRWGYLGTHARELLTERWPILSDSAALPMNQPA